MFFRTKLFDLFTHTPREGGRKEIPMPEAQATAPAAAATQQPVSAAAPAPAPDPRDDVARQLTTLTEAMRQLAESHKTLLDVVKAQPATTAAAPTSSPAPAPASPPADIGGDPVGGGQRPGAVVDYSRLSPVQQITLGLKDSPPHRATRAGAD